MNNLALELFKVVYSQYSRLLTQSNECAVRLKVIVDQHEQILSSHESCRFPPGGGELLR